MKINLIPEVKEAERKVRRINTIGTAVCILVLGIFIVIVIILSVANLAQNEIKKNTGNKISETEGRLKKFQDLEETVLSLENSLSGIKELLISMPKWSKFYSELEKAIPNDIQITNLKFKGNKITIDGNAQTIDSVARFIMSFKNYEYKEEGEDKGQKLFSEVNVSEVSSGSTSESGSMLETGSESEGRLKFKATMNLIEGLLW